MYDTQPFAPLYGPNSGSAAGSFLSSLTIAASGTAASGALPGNQGGSNNDFLQIQIANTTTAWAYVNFGQTTSNVVAATVAASFPVAPGVSRVVTVNSEVGAVSVILSTGTGNVVFTRGTGI